MSKIGIIGLPFRLNIPVANLYIPSFIEEAQGRLIYGVDNNLFIVVTGDPGCGKSTLIRALKNTLSGEEYIMLYLADSKLTPRWFNSGLLNQLGLQPRFYRGDVKNSAAEGAGDHPRSPAQEGDLRTG